MFKEYQIFEILQNDINDSINESLGISEVVSSETERICKIIENDILKSDKKLIASGVGYKNGQTKIEVFKNSKTIKGVNILCVNLSFRWEYYNFKDKHYKSKFLEKNGITTEGRSVLIINHYKRTKGKPDSGFVILNIFSTSGKIDENSFHDTISHEIRHVLETNMYGKQFNDKNLISFVNDYQHSDDKYERKIARALYLCNKHEQSAYSQGLYEFLKIEKWKYGDVDKALEKSDSYNIMLELKEIINFLKNIKDKDNLNYYLKKYKQFGINKDNFLKILDKCYNNMVTNIGKAIIKTKQEFIKEGLNIGRNYLYFQTSFYKRNTI